MKINDMTMFSRGRETNRGRIVAMLKSLSDDEIFTTEEMSKKIGIPRGTLCNYRSSFSEYHFRFAGTRWWGSKAAIEAAKKEIEKSENI